MWKKKCFKSRHTKFKIVKTVIIREINTELSQYMFAIWKVDFFRDCVLPDIFIPGSKFGKYPTLLYSIFATWNIFWIIKCFLFLPTTLKITLTPPPSPIFPSVESSKKVTTDLVSKKNQEQANAFECDLCDKIFKTENLLKTHKFKSP